MNRASTVSASSSLAVKRNALSGGSGSTCATPARAATSSMPAATPANSRRQCASSRRFGLRGDPVKVGGQATGDGDSDDFGKFVGMMPPDRLFDPRIEAGARLDGERDLVCRFDLAAPVIK